MDRKHLDELVQQERQKRNPLVNVKLISGNQLLINRHPYQIVLDKYHTFNLGAFKYRYNPVFSKFDYVLGDWSYQQLRLTGFYNTGRRKVPNYSKVNYLQDYLTEYCNFGVSYFLIRRLK